MATSGSATSSRTILKDSDTSWTRIPFLVSFGKTFSKVSEAVQYVSDASISEGSMSSFWGIDFGSCPQLGGNTLGSSAYTDTRCGANDAINCIWQFGRDDDLVYPVNQSGGTEECPVGLGRVYADTTNKNQTIAYFTFGVPHFANALEFYTRAFDAEMITYNTTGGFGLKEAMEKLFSIAGTVIKLAFTLPFLPFKLIGDLLSRSRNYRIDRFYDLRTTMHSYYRYVDSILTEWCVGTGMWGNADSIIPHEQLPYALQYGGTSIFGFMGLRAAIMRSSRKNESGKGYVTVNPATYEEALVKFSKMDPDEYDGEERADTGNKKGKENTKYPDGLNDASLVDDPNKSRAANAESGGAGGTRTFADGDPTGQYSNNRVDYSGDLLGTVGGATQFIGFRINKSVDASESFSNSTGPSPMADAFNNKVKQQMTSMFGEAAKGGTGIKLLDSVIGTVSSWAKDIGDFFGVSGIAEAVIGSAFIDVPESYRGSEYSKSHSLSFQLRSPNGDLSSIYQSIIVPLALLLGAALPRAGGPYSYQSPFLCRVYVKGMFAVPLGIIDSLSIKRGSSEFGWTYMNLPTCVDVNLSIKDLSPMIYMALSDKTFPDIFGANTSFKEYMLTLAGVSLHDRISRFKDYTRNLKTWSSNFNRLWNPTLWFSGLSDTWIGGAVGTFISTSYTPTN